MVGLNGRTVWDGFAARVEDARGKKYAEIHVKVKDAVALVEAYRDLEARVARESDELKEIAVKARVARVLIRQADDVMKGYVRLD